MVQALIIVVGVLAYVFVVFPAAMVLAAALRRRPTPAACEPDVSVLIPAYNERDCIAAKIENTFAADYPAEKLDVIVGSDGSDDGTDAIVRALALTYPRLRLLAVPGRVGKAALVNRLAAEARAPVWVLTDADVLIGRDAIRNLVRHFSDPAVGTVCARRSDRDAQPGTLGRAARLYNDYEAAIKRGEGTIGRVLGGNGALYAMRADLFEPLPGDVPDDFVNVLRTLARGRRAVYEAGALSWEQLPHDSGSEGRRRRRTVARGIRGLWAVRGLLNPLRHPLTAFLLLSHKVLRWFAGYLLAALLALNLALWRHPVWRWLLLAQLAGYALAAAGTWRLPGLPGRLCRAAHYFVLSNLGASAGVIDVLTGRDWRAWNVGRARPAPVGPPAA